MYIKAYMISMCYMNVNNKDHMYDAQIAKMKDQFNSINTKWTTFQESLILPTDKDPDSGRDGPASAERQAPLPYGGRLGGCTFRRRNTWCGYV